MKKFYLFMQNNSGGVFFCDKLSALLVVVKAESEQEACNIAKTYTDIYFNGVEEGLDCPCCGDRWDWPIDLQGSYDRYYTLASSYFTKPPKNYLIYVNEFGEVKIFKDPESAHQFIKQILEKN
ncbi:MAG: hypothetical protein N3A54_01170 [Patescibacteria group bacterium]|nr:hypothetical protein [Patescibacteria group bacterium]